MTKQEVYDYLDDHGIWHEITEHEAVFNMNQLISVELPYPECDAKNLFIRDDKKNNYYLITVKGDKRVNLKAFRKEHGFRPLSFGSADDLKKYMDLLPGSVSPFGLLNDKDHKVHFFLDRAFFDDPGLMGIHPNDNTATVWVRARELFDLIRTLGNPAEMIEIP